MIEISPSQIEGFIHSARGEKVILDKDLANIYRISVKSLNQVVKRNGDRFPEDFCFQLTQQEWENLRSQFVTSSYGGRRYRPWVFTEHGAVMAANVVRGERAIQMSIFIVRAFMKMRHALGDTRSLAAKLTQLESEITLRLDSHEKAIVELMQQFFSILNPSQGTEAEIPAKREMGFHVKDKTEGANPRLKRAR